jgi:hypothetical protein
MVLKFPTKPKVLSKLPSLSLTNEEDKREDLSIFKARSGINRSIPELEKKRAFKRRNAMIRTTTMREEKKMVKEVVLRVVKRGPRC